MTTEQFPPSGCGHGFVDPGPIGVGAEAPTGTPTPGPWTFQSDDTFSSLGDYRIVGADQISPAIVFGGIDEAEANVRLIAATPDLLKACLAIRDDILPEYLGDHPGSYRAIGLLHAALAKVDG